MGVKKLATWKNYELMGRCENVQESKRLGDVNCILLAKNKGK
jgi:hypothetical protein